VELPVHSVLDRLCTRAWQLVAPRFGDGLVARWPLEIDRGAPVANGIDNAVSTFSAHMQQAPQAARVSKAPGVFD
jgi:hypothetical protein